MPVCAETVSVNTSDGNEITVERFQVPGNGQSNTLLIWLPHESSPLSVDSRLARQLAARGIETWLVDLFNANFLPVAASSMELIPAEQITALIEAAHAKTGKSVYLFSAGRGAVPLLRGARHWQQHHPDGKDLAGVILLGPKLFVETPDPGLEGQLLPITSVSNLPIFILQSALSPWFWKLPVLRDALAQGGSDVFVRRLDEVRDRFYFRPDAVAKEQALTKKLPLLLEQATALLQTLPVKSRPAVTTQVVAPRVRSGKKDLRLQAFKGDPLPPPLVLNNLAGQPTDLRQLQGKVVLVNFWASWCPPCVHEMPSMARLAARFKQQAFTILAVNMAEDKQTIETFINTRVRVNFPIVLDRDGSALRSWKVFAFPTSYLIDKKGKIRYAVFGSIEWDTQEIVSTINTLLQE